MRSRGDPACSKQTIKKDLEAKDRSSSKGSRDLDAVSNEQRSITLEIQGVFALKKKV